MGLILSAQPATHLYSYQREDVMQWLRKRRLILAHETGLGKTVCAIECMRLSGVKKVLIVRPAAAYGVWERELKKWWPDHPGVLAVATGKKMPRELPPITITSYGQVAKVDGLGYDLIICDESHQLKNSRSGRSGRVAKIIQANAEAGVLLLSATPITIEPMDLWHQLNLINPHKWRSFYAFANLWCGRVKNDWSPKGYDWVGIAPGKEQALREAIRPYVVMRSKAEVADQLPPLLTAALTVPRKPVYDAASMLMAKLPSIVESIESIRRESDAPICVLTYLRESARTIASSLVTSGNVYRVDGSMTPKARDTIIEQARAPGSILVATMRSVGESIDLTAFTSAYFAELYAAPSVIAQAAGRFHRLSSKAPSLITFVLCEGCGEELIVARLRRRLSELTALSLKGVTVDAVESALEPEAMSDDDIFASIAAKIAASDDGDDQ